MCVSACVCQVVMKWCSPAPLRAAVTSYTDSHQSSLPLHQVLPGNAVPVSHLALIHACHAQERKHTLQTASDTLCHSAMIQEGGGRCEKAHPDCMSAQKSPAALNNSHQGVMSQTKQLKLFLSLLTL